MKLSRKRLSASIIVTITLLSIWCLGVKFKDHKSFLFQLREIISPTDYSQKQTQYFQADLSTAAIRVRHQKLGQKYAKAGDYNKAIVEYQKAIELAQQDPAGALIQINYQKFPRSLLFEAYGKAGMFDDAIEQIDWLLAHNPSESYRFELETWKNVITAERDSRYEMAIKHIDIALNSADLKKYEFAIQKLRTKRQEFQQRLE